MHEIERKILIALFAFKKGDRLTLLIFPKTEKIVIERLVCATMQSEE